MSDCLKKIQDQEALPGAEVQSLEAASLELTFPDGGRKAWLTVAGGMLAQISSIGFLSAFSVFQSYYSQVTLPNSSASDISWIGSLQIFGCFFLGLWAGRLSDKRGPTLPLGLGTFFMVFGTMMASISSSYYQFVLSQGICCAIGFGLVFTPALAVQSQWFLRKRGFVVGLVMSGQNVGGVIWPVLVDRLINNYGLSLGWTLRTIGFMQLFLMVAATLMVHPRFPEMPQEPIPVKQFLTDKRSILFTCSTLLFFFGIYIPYFYITPYAMQWGASLSMAFYMSSILNTGAFFGCYILGVASDHGLGPFNTLTAVAFGCAVTAFGWIGAKNTAGMIVWSIIYGFLSGALQAGFSPCVSHLAPGPGLIGTWNGLCISITSFAVLGMGPIAGKLFDNTGDTNYLPMQLFTGVFLISASTLYLITRLFVSRKAIA
ncbi:major facilitator superfamily domain-containing protein [Aspergillus novoparasiticus]|uniref:Major facilitator superfamily domain-containing protein n=1 Tax=Aspergillus novoparasiticus TaxID=986946 RepID=A0A5N6EML3_9EURO|nr:major facilitator superfamily domain-containing protein [Aspergillus novoparasiticus]